MSTQLWNWLYQTAHTLFVSQFKISWPEHDVWQVTIIKAQFLVVVSTVNFWYPASFTQSQEKEVFSTDDNVLRKSNVLPGTQSVTVFLDGGTKEGGKGLWRVVEEGVDREQSVIILLKCLSVNCVSDLNFVVSVAVTTCITTQQTSCAVHLGTKSQSHLWSGESL
jgi:hypothetical protein